VAILGMVYFGGMLVLSLPRAWATATPPVRRARVVAAAGGAAVVLYLLYVELFVVDAVCLWCTVVHVVTVSLFAVVVWGTAETAEP
jgi:uncharacterized membrane protein